MSGVYSVFFCDGALNGQTKRMPPRQILKRWYYDLPPVQTTFGAFSTVENLVVRHEYHLVHLDPATGRAVYILESVRTEQR